MIKSRGYAVNEAVLSTLLHLRLKDELVPRSRADTEVERVAKRKRRKQEQHRSRKQRKMDSERKEVEKELREAEAVVNQEEKEKMVGFFNLNSKNRVPWQMFLASMRGNWLVKE